ncbi:MAG: hypothetical protein AB7O52_08575 [Planctomycetota bacterium]
MSYSTRMLLRGATLLVAFTLAPARADEPARAEVQGRLLYETADGVYVDVGELLLPLGTTGALEFSGDRTTRFEVVSAARGSVFLRLEFAPGAQPLTAGAALVLWLDAELPTETPSAAELRSPTLKAPGVADTEQPLLAERALRGLVPTDPVNVFHGRLSFRQLFQKSSNDDIDSLRSQARSEGTFDRIDGTPWALEWSLGVSYRDGEGLQFVDDYQQARLDLYRLSMVRRFDDESSLRLGRFIPRELPAVGYFDGLQVDEVLSPSWRVGVLAGFKPYRDDLDISVKEPVVVPYTTYGFGSEPRRRVSGTLGLLASLYEEESDRLAFLWDQTLQWSTLHVFSSAEFDLDIGGAEEREGPRVTRLNLVGSIEVGQASRLRAGVDRYEIPDTEGERDQIDDILLQEADFLQSQYNRYWVGGTQRLSAHWSLEEEVSFTDSTTDDDYRWRLGITRRGLPGLAAGSGTLHVYRLAGVDLDGVGGRLTLNLPLGDQRFLFSPSVAFRLAEFELDSEQFWFSEVSARAHWVASDSWTFDAGVLVGLTEDDATVQLDVGLSYRW